MIGGTGGALAAYLPEGAARELIAPRHAVVAGSIRPRGEAEVVDGGYRVSGVWPLASGAIMRGGRARTEANGEVDVRLMLIPATECDVLDTWHSTGLRGTGSSDFRVRAIVVPLEGRWVTTAE